MIAAETYPQLMTDLPHIFFELSMEALTGLALYPLLRRVRGRFARRLHEEIDSEHGVVHVEDS